MNSRTVLVVDDEQRVITGLTRDLMLEAPNYLVASANSVQEAQTQFNVVKPDLVLTDIRMAGEDGFTLLRHLHKEAPQTPTVVMSGAADTGMVRQAFLCGAVDFLEKPFTAKDLLATVARVFGERPKLPSDISEFCGLVGGSPAMRELYTSIARVAPSRATVVVQGESGTGKELVAKALHDRSPRAGKAFIAINCGALTESLLENELFGHEKGAFTGAERAKEGLFEAAHEGSIFLDEIGEVTPGVQLRLLRVLQEGQVQRIGSTVPRPVDVRVIAATHADLPAMVKRGAFREDLYFRLHVIEVLVPPLRARPEDIPALAEHFRDKYAQQNGKRVTHFSQSAMEALCAHPWPGNVRELENAINRAVVLCEGDGIELQLLALQALEGKKTEPTRASPSKLDDTALLALVEGAGGSLSKAAKLAGIDRSNFRRLLKARGLYDALSPAEGASGADKREANDE